MSSTTATDDRPRTPAERWELAPLPPDDGAAPSEGGVRPPEHGDGYLTAAEAAAELAGLEQDLAARERAQVAVVGRLERLVRSKRIEQLEGLAPDMWLNVVARQSGLDAWLLLTAVDVLARMPVTRTLFAEGTLSWSQICRIVARVRKLPADAQRTVDRRIDASRDMLDALGVDGLDEAVDKAARELDGPQVAERNEQQARTDGFVHVQGKLFGGIKLYGEYDDPVEAATITNGLEHAARTAKRRHDTDDAQHADGTGDGSDGGREDGGDGGFAHGGQRSFWQSRGLLAMCQTALAANHDDGGDGGNFGAGSKRAKPSVLVHVDVADCTTTNAGQVELNVTGGGLPDITKKRLEEILTVDHDCRVVLFDGGRPLAVSDLIHAEHIPTRTRIAVRARDRGCRFDRNTPAGRAHLHHLDGKDAGHHPDRLLTLGAWPHLRGIHRHGWTATVLPDATTVWTRGWRTFRTLPWGTPLRRLSDEEDDDPDANG